MHATLLGHGISLWKFPVVYGGGGTVIFAPVLSWASTSLDTTPDFDIDLPSGNGAPYDAAANDVLRIEWSQNSFVSSTTYLTRTLSAGDIVADTINDTSPSALSTGSYDFRARLERSGGTVLGAWSNTVAVTIAASDDDDFAAWLAAA